MKKSSSFFLLVLFLVANPWSPAAPPKAANPLRAVPDAVRDLRQGLAYLRVHSLGDAQSALEAALKQTQPLVLDLRYTTVSADSAAALRDALVGRGVPSAPLFILVSPATPRVVADALAQLPANALTLGDASSNPAPKTIVQTTPETDRRAYDALDAGTPLEALLSGKIDKNRYDEATLVKDFTNGNHNPEPPPPPDPAAKKSDSTPPAPPPLTDRVLQRAVHLHRTLLSLNRLSKPS